MKKIDEDEMFNGEIENSFRSNAHLDDGQEDQTGGCSFTEIAVAVGGGALAGAAATVAVLYTIAMRRLKKALALKNEEATTVPVPPKKEDLDSPV